MESKLNSKREDVSERQFDGNKGNGNKVESVKVKKTIPRTYRYTVLERYLD
jgi:hypothetical protein